LNASGLHSAPSDRVALHRRHDPGSKLQQIAERERFRSVAFGKPSIGGRYSVLSDFGMVPAALMG